MSAGLFLAAAFSVEAAPPPGHPSPNAAMQLMRPGVEQSAALKRTGVALDAIDANEYTYIEVDEAGRSYWIATARMKIVRGDMVQFEDGVTMAQFYSKLLKRTFDSVMFVGSVSTTPGGK
ncbi:hypothetical protein [Aromatoleum diolicum]|uniref:Uncharacterized protein n=1 Tax=Aromatoleum diolicum TaxID=75796 RepID=A0ABX1Q9W8_9RHOO|nr:hypothetical protein [Aromatoleum diolicum]NMG75108.1 hypothetical protein [Aromatoleum diolicum]